MTAEALRDVSRLRLLGILSGTWTAQACYVLAKLGLPDRLADGPRTAAEPHLRLARQQTLLLK